MLAREPEQLRLLEQRPGQGGRPVRGLGRRRNVRRRPRLPQGRNRHRDVFPVLRQHESEPRVPDRRDVPYGGTRGRRSRTVSGLREHEHGDNGCRGRLVFLGIRRLPAQWV